LGPQSLQPFHRITLQRSFPSLQSIIVSTNRFDRANPSNSASRLIKLLSLSEDRDHDVTLMNGVIVIVAYRPKSGRERETLDLVRSRVPTLHKEELVTDRAPVIMRARDGTIIEVSEWKSQEAIDAAHKNPNVLVMWNRFFEVCDCIPLNTLSESAEMFAGFEPVSD
jgi:quinol monooxygenase YgiN